MFTGIILKLKIVIITKLNAVPNNKVVELLIKHKNINIKTINLLKKKFFALNLRIINR